MQLRDRLDAAEGVRKADLVLERRSAGQRRRPGRSIRQTWRLTGDMIAAVGDVSRHKGPDTTVLDVTGRYLVPGLIDGHLHIECSKLSITMFADAVVRYGTTSVVSGLDQTYAVAGLEGVRDALTEAADSPMKVFWAAPYKVPYTIPETNVGFRLGPEVHEIAQRWHRLLRSLGDGHGVHHQPRPRGARGDRDGRAEPPAGLRLRAHGQRSDDRSARGRRHPSRP